MFDTIFWNDAIIIFQRHNSKMTKYLLDNHKSGDKSEGPIFMSVILNGKSSMHQDFNPILIFFLKESSC